MWRSVFFAVLLGTAAQAARKTWATLPQPNDPRESYPSAPVLRALSLGYKPLAADYFWLRAVSHFGDPDMHNASYPNLEALLRRTVALDPFFYSAYHFAGLVLTLKGFDPAVAVELLEQGAKYRPDQWMLGYLLGFNQFFFLGNDEAALTALNAAAVRPGAPESVSNLASRIAADIGQAETALPVIETLLAQTEDEDLRAVLEERRGQLLIEIELQQLQHKVAEFETRFGQRPKHLRDLVDSGFIQSTADPLGGIYYLAPDGNVTSTTPRLRLHRERAKP